MRCAPSPPPPVLAVRAAARRPASSAASGVPVRLSVPGRSGRHATASHSYALRTACPGCRSGNPTIPRAHPRHREVVGDGGRPEAVPVADLLPESYVWADHQLDAG
ncbi:exported hypothetical protein [Actinacidiphila cocklensis]|uniref:Uncharacterized protein n=1 Tax=Actinacidiphila cocklensis TaxID=887465 RepID=A0A9W4GU23_9ACTN|nr:exported hypothetical protein [Actinacidiphila cocklensis]